MGNQQSAGMQFCSGGQLHTRRSTLTSYKSNLDTRVGYNFSNDISTEPKFQVQRIQNAHQQMAPQQQGQEELVEMMAVKKVPVVILDKEEELVPKTKEVVKPVEAEVVYNKDGPNVFEGVFGNVITNKNGLVLYTDITGRMHRDEYDRDTIGKIFPMGISFGGLTKSIWFKDVVARDNCFDLMAILPPPSYRSVMANPTNFYLPEESELQDDSENMKVFEGIKGRNVIVHAENIVLYTDINGNKHCIHYDKKNIRKCFPNGIQYGGLKRTIWLKDQMERDLCFMLMQWNMEEEGCEEITEESPNQEFTGLYGGVVLHSDSQIEFTSLSGDRVKCFYEPCNIMQSFPKGISYGRLPKTIWFRDIKERERCIDAMRKM